MKDNAVSRKPSRVEKTTSKNKVHKNPTISPLVYLQEYSTEHTIYGDSSF